LRCHLRMKSTQTESGFPTKPAKPKRGRGVRNKEKYDLAEALNVTPRRAGQILKEHADQSADTPQDDAAKPDAAMTTEELKRLRAEKYRVEIEKIRQSIDIQNGKYVLVSEMQEQAAKAIAILKAQIQTFVASLPGRLEGLTASQMAPVVEEEGDRMLQMYADAL
jgi:hypothetical protein